MQLDKTCSQLVGKTNIIRAVLDNNDTKTICDEPFISEIQMDYMNDCPLYETKLSSLKVPPVLLNMRFKAAADDVKSAMGEIKLLVQQQNATAAAAACGGESDFAELTPLNGACAGDDRETTTTTSDTDNSHLFESFESEIRRESFSTVHDPYPKKLQDFVAHKLVQKRVHTYEGIVRRLSVINREIWTVMNDGHVIVTASDNGSIKRKVKVKERNPDPSWWSRLLNDDLDIVYDCLTVCEGCEGDIVCLGKIPHTKADAMGVTETQVVMIDSDGLVQNKLATGNYVDITTDDKALLTLMPGTPNKIDIFRSDGAKGSSYLHMRTVSLEIGRTYYRLLSIAGVLYVTGLRHEVHKYHIETGQRYTHGTYGGRLPGELDTPKLCCVDDYGVILLADCQNHRLQILDREKQWHVLDVTDVTCPWDAGWDSHSGQLYFVASQAQGKNVLYRVYCKANTADRYPSTPTKS